MPAMNVLFLTRSLERGGAERQLVTLAMGLHKLGHRVTVVQFYPRGPLAEPLRKAGIAMLDLGKQSRWDLVKPLWQLRCIIRRLRPDIIHGYLTEPNLFASFMRLFFPDLRVVWGIRSSDMQLQHYDPVNAFTFRISRWLAPTAHLILANSYAGQEYHVDHGYPADNLVVIPNGIDTDTFQPDPEARERLRQEWHIAPEQILVGMVARLDPMKDHPTFLQAAAIAVQRQENLRFVCVGDGPEQYRAALLQQSRALGLTDDILRWIPARDDMPAVFSALDLGVSASQFGEGFSNSIGEGMACGVPFVVTRVGDSAFIVADTGIAVAPGDPAALANGLLELVEQCRQAPAGQLGERARQRILGRFTVQRLIYCSEELLEETLV